MYKIPTFMTVKPLSVSQFDWMILEYKIPTFMTVKPLSVSQFDWMILCIKFLLL